MSDANLIHLSIDPESETPLFQQVYEELRRRISSGTLKPKTRLPSSRAFAEELGISRSSVVAAYDQLMAEGYIESRERAGIYVGDLPDLNIKTDLTSKDKATENSLSDDYKVNPFYPGMPDMRLFPFTKWAQCVARVAREYPEEIITVKARFGDIRLRQAIADHLLEWRGIAASPDQIIVTAGAIGGMELVMRVMSERSDRIAIENPGYSTFRNLLLNAGINPVYLQIDEQGAKLPQTEKSPKIIYLTPSYQYPLGGIMPTGRRADFLNYASEHNCWIVEDDFDSEFRYSGKPIQALTGMDDDRVFYSGSFAKIFSVGLRIGYLVVPEKYIDRFSESLTRYSKSASISPQRALAVFMESGEFHKHIRRMRRIYGKRRKLFVDLLNSNKGLYRFVDNHAGMQIALLLEETVNDRKLSEDLQTSGIICPPLSAFYANEACSGLLMGFCSFTEQEITDGMEKFFQVIKNA